jgi:predicted nucleic acid-binding protein
MKVVIDSNVLFRTLISSGDILKIVFNNSLKLYAPLNLVTEISHNKIEILKKSKLTNTNFEFLLNEILLRIDLVPLEEYKDSLPIARKLLAGHIKDDEFLALAINKNIKLWTYESRFFKLGYAISTKELSNSLV